MNNMMLSSDVGKVKYEHDSTYGIKVFKWLYNPSGSTMSANTPVAQKFNPATYLGGHELIAPATAHLDRAIGIVDTDILTVSWGWVQTWGYRATASCEGTTDITAGDSLKMVDAQTYLIKDQAPGTEPTYHRHFLAAETWTTNSAANKKIIIRCEM